MDKLILALGPAFAAGFAVQRLLEILDPVLDKVKAIKDNKKVTLGLVSLIVGLVLAFGIGLRVLEPLGVANAGIFDGIATALIISAGTDGINSIIKFLGYAKEDKKAEAADKKENAEKKAIEKLERAV